MELLGILLQHRTDKSALDNKSMRTLQRMQPILQHMHEHVSDPLQAQHLAALFKLSFSRFHELFTQATGISPGQYQLRLRLQHAQILLASSDESISSIAEACGYTDNHYFSRIFKKTMGMTPGEWRRQYNTQQPV